MTEKDYELVARAFNRVKKDKLKPEFVFGALVRELQVDFSIENPQFDRKNLLQCVINSRFVPVEACHEKPKTALLILLS